MMNIKQWVKNHKKEVVIGTIVVAGTVAGVIITKKVMSTDVTASKVISKLKNYTEIPLDKEKLLSVFGFNDITKWNDGYIDIVTGNKGNVVLEELGEVGSAICDELGCACDRHVDVWVQVHPV